LLLRHVLLKRALLWLLVGQKHMALDSVICTAACAAGFLLLL
jgi:hypothetical protein